MSNRPPWDSFMFVISSQQLFKDGRYCSSASLFFILYTPKLPQQTQYTCRFAVLKLRLPLDGAGEPAPGMCLFIWCVCVMSCFRREMWRPSEVRRTRGSERLETLWKWWSLVWTISWRTNSSHSWVEANTASLSLSWFKWSCTLLLLCFDTLVASKCVFSISLSATHKGVT